MHVQHRLHDLQHRAPADEEILPSYIQELDARRSKLRKALRKNFSRPFRDAMRNMDVALPGPFAGLLQQLHLSPNIELDTTLSTTRIGQVLKDETPPKPQLRAPTGEFTFDGKNNTFIR